MKVDLNADQVDYLIDLLNRVGASIAEVLCMPDGDNDYTREIMDHTIKITTRLEDTRKNESVC